MIEQNDKAKGVTVFFGGGVHLVEVSNASIKIPDPFFVDIPEEQIKAWEENKKPYCKTQEDAERLFGKMSNKEVNK